METKIDDNTHIVRHFQRLPHRWQCARALINSINSWKLTMYPTNHFANSMVDFTKEKFAPVFEWPANVKPKVLDLSGRDAEQLNSEVWTIGRYNEKRGIYTTALFGGVRNIHVGIDLGGPVGHEVHLPCEGRIAFQGYNPAEGDYGNCVITRHEIQGKTLFLLFGHLDGKSISHPLDTVLPQGYVIGRLGDRHENGGWPPHVHFQLSWRVPTTHDLPGAVSEQDLEQSLIDFPDPQLILGKLND